MDLPQGILVSQIQTRTEPEESPDEHVRETGATQGFTTDGANISDPHWRVVRPPSGTIKFEALREGAFVCGGRTATAKFYGVLPIAQMAQTIHRFRRPAGESAHGAMIRPIGTLGGGILQGLGAHPIFHQQFSFSEIAHFLTHRLR
jgi:hypothetical protein